MTGFTPRHLSASSVTKYLRCPAEWFFSYVKKIPQPENAPMLFGKAMHTAVQAFHEGRDAQAVFARAWLYERQRMTELGIPYTPVYAELGPTLLALYEDDPLPDGTCEVSARLNVPGIAVPIRLVLDLVYDEGRCIGELKTAGVPWEEGRAETEFQGQLYRVCAEPLTDTPLSSLTYTVLSVAPRPLLTRIVLPPANKELEDSVREVCRVVLQSIAAGIWTPRCAPSACRYPLHCPELRAVSPGGMKE